MAAEDKAALSQPLLASEPPASEDVPDGAMATAVSDCKLQDKCFLSVGTAEASAAYTKVQRKLVIACVLCFIFMIVEVVGGYIAKSVAIMSDAAHMLSDVSAFLVSIFAAWAATQPSSWHYSFGYHRAEILGALVSVLTIWAVTGALVFEAVQRTINPVRVDGKLMFIISVAGVCFNVLIALALGVHAHLGHSHGPGGCSGGHGHDHGHSDHDHSSGHSHSHSHNYSHEHSHSSNSGTGCKHKHENGHHNHGSSAADKAAAPKSCGHNHEHGKHGHNHSHSHDSSCSSSGSSSTSADVSNTPLLSEQQAAAATTAAAAAGASSNGTANTAAVAGTAAKKDCVVIDFPATATGVNCGLAGHELSCRCTIARTGSHEIEVRCELPAAAVVCCPSGSAAGTKPPVNRPSTSHGHNHQHQHGHGGDSINLRSAVLHVIGDILQSIGVAIAGALIWWNQDDPRWYLADPICTFIFSIMVLLTTRAILRDIIHVLMERTPTNIDIPAMSQVISDMDGVRDVHDLHIWNISTSTSPVLTAHVNIGPDADANVVLQKLEQYVRGVGIQHSTIQICNPLQATLPP